MKRITYAHMDIVMTTSVRRRIPRLIGASCISAALLVTVGATTAIAATQSPTEVSATAPTDSSGTDPSGGNSTGSSDTGSSNTSSTDTSGSGITDTTHQDTNAGGQTSTDTSGAGTTDTTHQDTNAGGQTSTDTSGAGTTDTTHQDTNAGGQTSTDTSGAGTTDTTHQSTNTSGHNNGQPGTDTSGTGLGKPTPVPVGTPQRNPNDNSATPFVDQYNKLTPAQQGVVNQGAVCVTGGLSKQIGKVLKLATKNGDKDFEIFMAAYNGAVMGKDITTGEIYDLAWATAESIPGRTGTIASCIRVGEKVIQQYDEQITKQTAEETNQKLPGLKNTGPVKIQQAPGVQQNPLSTGKAG
ncbi:hypothetical protein ACFVW1_47655 [Streptomyces olivochromogenes]|uniref:hypothetical protein n=1 Tax=Streptomyces olivochromogenes TaxID=1963 RepID=UPI0036DCFA73